MQMNEKVLTALEVLKDCAENEFERYRIDVLIKDFTDPPKVVQVDEKHQKFNNRVYRLDGKDHYISGKYIHQDVWEYYRGAIPTGYVVHHENLNPADNDISNLALKTPSEHSKLHSKISTKQRLKDIYICDYCGKKIAKSYFNSNVQHHFCNDTCKALWRNKNVLKITQSCVICGKEFVTRKRGKNTASTCSCHCRNVLRWKRVHENKKGTNDDNIGGNTTAKKNECFGLGGFL